MIDSLRTAIFRAGPALASRLSRHVVSRFSAGKNAVYLTFDDGPSDGTNTLVDYLLERRIPAAFFLTGEKIESNPESAARLASHFACGNHYYTHADPWRLPNGEVSKAISETEKILDTIKADGSGSVRLNIIRPPFGHISRALLKWCEQQNASTVLWDVMPGDFRDEANPGILAEVTLNSIRDGSIIVLHDSGLEHVSRVVIPLLDQLSSGLSARDLQFGDLRDRIPLT